MQKNYVGGIQALRLLACFFVLFQHVTFFVCDFKGIDYHPFLMINFGRVGVSLFFVISGYVMGMCLDQGRVFLWNRIARIYPPYWLAIVVSWVVLVPLGVDWAFDIRSVLLLPTLLVNSSYKIPYWTLCYEMAFYVLVFALVLVKASRQNILWFCAAWLSVIIVIDAYTVIGDIDSAQVFALVAQPGWGILVAPYPIFFIAGLVASIGGLARFERVPPVFLVFIAVCTWAVSNNMKLPSPAPMFIMQSFSFICLIAASRQMAFPSFITRLGDYSYGIYLVHMIIIGALIALFKSHAVEMRFSGVFAIFMLCSIIGGCAFGWFEHKLHSRFVKRLFRRKSVQPVAIR
ncbi:MULTISPECIES: acyltransferase family protein [unclassified Pseudomonas]|uniref:acyltransferase family protein n=1 Tax=unclassified Pseudomonas TaxID=196821 RepID=UPI00132EB3A5|nr:MULTISPECIES: acyltransferase [unclassified Pseudomonas]QHF49458.1 hypothetical protein PspS49_07390 [Pseudomonas sp. S49]WNZ85749.1 acyltransferase [Pseudomonas sp. P108]